MTQFNDLLSLLQPLRRADINETDSLGTSVLGHAGTPEVVELLIERKVPWIFWLGNDGGCLRNIPKNDGKS